jgi:hypothetical protein
MEGTQIYDTYICIDVSITLKLICKKQDGSVGNEIICHSVETSGWIV